MRGAYRRRNDSGNITGFMIAVALLGLGVGIFNW